MYCDFLALRWIAEVLYRSCLSRCGAIWKSKLAHWLQSWNETLLASGVSDLLRELKREQEGMKREEIWKGNIEFLKIQQFALPCSILSYRQANNIARAYFWTTFSLYRALCRRLNDKMLLLINYFYFSTIFRHRSKVQVTQSIHLAADMLTYPLSKWMSMNNMNKLDILVSKAFSNISEDRKNFIN